MKMFFSPLGCVVYLHILYFLEKFVVYGDCKPLPILKCFYFISILPFVFFELDIIQKNKCIASLDFVKISEPRKNLRLMNRNYHLESVTKLLRIFLNWISVLSAVLYFRIIQTTCVSRTFLINRIGDFDKSIIFLSSRNFPLTSFSISIFGRSGDLGLVMITCPISPLFSET